MDPVSCLKAARESLEEGNPELCADFLDHYANWRARGGFEPPRGDDIAQAYRNRLARGAR